MADITLRSYKPSDRAWLVDQDQPLYRRDEGFDDTFGPLGDNILQDFECGHDPAREHGWIAEADGRRLGSICCVTRDADTAKLRMCLLVPEARGKGAGKRLLAACMNFACRTAYRHMVLWTHESHKAACTLYAAFGWHLTRSEPVHSFGVYLVEQTWEIDLQPPCNRVGRGLNEPPVPP